MTRSIALVTCAELPAGDDDSHLLGESLSAAGIDSSWQVWSDPDVDWSRFDLVVVRATWDYTVDRGAFLRWARSLPHLANPAEVIAWNTDKTYLRELVEAGVPVVPTEWINPGEAVELPGGEIVVKPSIGAGSMGAGRFDAASSDERDAAHAHAVSLHDAGRTVMIQPYLADVDTAGETSLIYFDATYSHAIRKGAMLPQSTAYDLSNDSASLYVPEQITPRDAEPGELRLGERVLGLIRARFGEDLLYTRIDVLPTPDGPVLIELELTEPSLFLDQDAGAAGRLAAAIATRLG